MSGRKSEEPRRRMGDGDGRKEKSTAKEKQRKIEHAFRVEIRFRASPRSKGDSGMGENKGRRLGGSRGGRSNTNRKSTARTPNPKPTWGKSRIFAPLQSDVQPYELALRSWANGKPRRLQQFNAKKTYVEKALASGPAKNRRWGSIALAIPVVPIGWEKRVRPEIKVRYITYEYQERKG